MSTVTLNELDVTRARVQIPAFGIWWADVEIASEVELAGAVVLRFADLELRGTIRSGGPYQGTSRYRIAAGAGGWGSEVVAKSYANDLGVKRSTVLLDAAAAADEVFAADTIPADRIGPAYVREAGPMSRVLHHLAPEAWYVGEDGTTRIGRRARVDLTLDVTRSDEDIARGVIELASDQVGEIVPGVVVDGLEAVDVEHRLEDRKIRSTLWVAGLSSTARRLTAWRRLIDQVLPDLRYRGLYEYRIVSQDGERLNLQAVRVSVGLPDLGRVPVRPGVPGCRADHVLGSLVLVAFVNADPARPVVVAFDDPDSPGFVPDELHLANADGRVLREGDTLSLTGVQSGAGTTGVIATVTTGLGTPPEPSRVMA